MSKQVQPLKPLEMTLQDAHEEAPGVKSFTFKYDKAQFQYKAGQSVLLFPEQGNQALRHPFSIASSPTEDQLMLSTKIRPESPYKTRLNALTSGDKVTLMGPGGQFTLPEQGEDQIVLLGGGIGITPFRGIIKYATDKQLHYKITLLYSNRTPEDIVYKQDWERFQSQNPNLTIIHTITRPEESQTEWKGHTGRIDANLVHEYVPNMERAIFYVCGPPSLVSYLTNILAGMGVDPGRIRAENFRGYAD